MRLSIVSRVISVIPPPSLCGAGTCTELLTHVVAVHAPRAGATAAAYLMELADAALALILGLIAELEERLGLTPDFRERRRADVAAVERQIPARLNLPHMLMKQNPVPPRQPRVMASMPNVAGVRRRLPRGRAGA